MPSSNKVLELLNYADWKVIQLKLAEYAVFKISRLYWRTAQGTLPRGLSVEDLVIQAIHKTYEGAHAETGGTGLRKWNPEVQPDLLSYLKSVVDSDISHLINSEEHKLTNYNSLRSHEEAAELMENVSVDGDLSNPDSKNDHYRTPEDQVLRKEAETDQSKGFESFFKQLMGDFRSDKEVSLLLLSYREQSLRGESIKPATVSKETGMDIEVVRNAIKRLKRRLLSMKHYPLERGKELNVAP